MNTIFKTKSLKIIAICVLALGTSAFITREPIQSYKCMIQMANYTGEKAYVVVSLINPEGQYEKTLYVQGDDKEWFPDLIQWWKFSKSTDEKIDAITGATIGNGQRNIISLTIDETYINNNYKLRFESAVENQEYYLSDVEVTLESETLQNKVNGKGYIRYVRIVPN